MRKIKNIYFYIITICLLSVYSASAETIDRIVAVVNDEPITQSELDSLLMPIYEQYRAAYTGQEFVTKMAEARANLLSQLIEDRLVSQEAKRLNVEVSEEEINAQLQELRDKFPSEEEFKKFIAEQNMTIEKIREKYKDQIAIRKLHQYEVRGKIVVSPQDVEKYYQEHIEDFTEKEKIKIRTIMIKKKKEDGTDDAVNAHNLLKVLADRIKAGEDFSELAKQYSQGSHAADGGEIGFIKRGEMIAGFDEVLFNLNVGELSPILETDIAYHLFLVEGKQEKEAESLQDVKDEIYNILFRTKAKERFQTWMEELKSNAYISIK